VTKPIVGLLSVEALHYLYELLVGNLSGTAELVTGGRSDPESQVIFAVIHSLVSNSPCVSPFMHLIEHSHGVFELSLSVPEPTFSVAFVVLLIVDLADFALLTHFFLQNVIEGRTSP